MDRIVSIHLDRSSSTPLYMQIYEGIANLIEKGAISYGEKLPPIRQMASFFNVNTVTVVNAYKQLEMQGFVKSRMGSGTYVSFLPEKKNFDEFPTVEGVASFSQETDNSMADAASHIKFDFAGASISPKYFPVKDFKDVVNEVLDRDGGYALEYQESSGYQPLRESIKEFMKIEHDLLVPFEEIQIVSGAQQGIDILAKAFLNFGDVVYVEAPTYPGAINAFRSRGAHIVEINMEEDGIDLNVLKKHLAQNPPKLFYTMPVFQNPTGYSYSSKKKQELIALAKKHNFYIIEDDHISDLYYREKPVLLKALDDGDKVLYIKSFSKLFLPGLRLAFLWVPEIYSDKTALAKYSSDISSSGFFQRALDLFLRKGLWCKHVRRLRKVFFEKWQKTHEALAMHMPQEVKYNIPEGGHFFWLQLPNGYYSMYLYELALKEGVSIMPGNLFYLSQKPTEGFRLSFAQISVQSIDVGIQKLSECIKQQIQNTYTIIQGPDERPLL